MAEMELPAIIKGWCDEYGVPAKNISFEYDDLGFGVNGDCTWWAGTRHIHIRISRALEGRGRAEEEALWHEYCHAEEFWTTGHGSGHGEPWKTLYARRSYSWVVKVVQAVYSWIYLFKKK